MTEFDTSTETAAIAQMRADRTPPFTSREVVVRLLATTYPAHALEPSVRRAAARDKHLEWRAGTGGYGYRGVVAPAPVMEPFSGAVDAWASTGQPDRSGDHPESAPAPRERGLDLIAGASDLASSTPDAPAGVGGLKSFRPANSKTGDGPERQIKHAISSKNEELGNE